MSEDKHTLLIAEKLGLTQLELAEYVSLHTASQEQPFCPVRNRRLCELTMLISAKLRTQGRNKVAPQDMAFLNESMKVLRPDEDKPVRYNIELLYKQLHELDELMNECAA